MFDEKKLTFENNITQNSKDVNEFSELLKSVLGVAPHSFNLLNEDIQSVVCNDAILDIFGIKNNEDFPESFFELSPPVQPNGVPSREMARNHYDLALKNGKHEFNWMHLTANGEKLPCAITLIKLENIDEENYVAGFVRDLRSEFSYPLTGATCDCYFQDILPRNVLMDAIADLSGESYYSIDLRTSNLHYYNTPWIDARSQKEVIQKDDLLKQNYVHEDDIATYKEMMENIKIGEVSTCDIRFLVSENNYRYHKLTCKLLTDNQGTPVFVVGKGVDVHEHKVIEERSQKDLLTDCYNKISAENIITEKLNVENGATHAFFIIDIDNFKSINDNLGHFFGDEVLRDISTGLKAAFRDIDIVARIGGDEFIIFVENLSDMKIITKKAEKILEVYRKTYSGEYKDYSISGSVGVALFPRDGATYGELYQNADKALSQAKIQGKNRFLIYSEDLNIGTTRSTTKIENANRIASSFFDYDLISAVFNILYEKNGDSDSINLALSYLCQKYNADRSYVFESLDGGATFDNTFEYCKEGISSEIDNLQGLSYGLFEDFIGKAHNDIIYSNDLRETLEHDKAFELMDDQGILSFVHAQVKRDGIMTFFIGLDDCTKTRVWTEREINSLQYIGKILSIILQGTHLRDEINTLAVSNKNSADILDCSSSVVYVSDLNTYEVLYLNEMGRKTINAKSEEDYLGKKCYKVLQGHDEPCEFCTNHLLKEDEYYEWSFHNPILDTSFLLKDKLINFNGSKARLEIATDITKIVSLEQTLTDRLSDEHFLMDCVEMLHSGNEPNKSIYSLLEAVTAYYDAERSYIFEVSECKQFISNTYEHCKTGSIAYIDKLQKLPIAELGVLLNKCEDSEAFSLNIDALDENALEYDLMKLQGLTDIIIGAIRIKGKEVTGFVGVDNSQKNKDKVSIIRTVAKFTATFLDETELVANLNRLSYYDMLTGIKNRHSYSLALKSIDKSVNTLGVLYVDIIGLSAINDAKGIVFGDSILVRLSKILCSIFGDSVYRVGGDEFVVISQDITESDFEENLDKFKQLLAKETDFKTTIGYTWNKNFKNLNGDLSNLHEGENYARILRENLEMEISDCKYIVHLQPQMNLSSGKVESAEALVRRLGADNALQAPAYFLPFYEKEGIISIIDEFVFETVCKSLKSWKDMGAESLPVISVNCSRMTVSENGIVEKFSKICDRYDVERSLLVIEITETINGIGESVLAGIIKEFSDAGFLVSLDDFGSGYSNLNSLVVSDFDEIKIDMKIVGGIHKEEKSKALTQVAITLCESLNNLTSVAEGVETQLQHDMLCEMGCDKGQGYYYAKPMPIDEFTAKYSRST